MTYKIKTIISSNQEEYDYKIQEELNKFVDFQLKTIEYAITNIDGIIYFSALIIWRTK